MKKTLFSLVFIIFIFSCVESHPDNEVNARVMMWQFVKRNLKDPGSADFGLCKMDKKSNGNWSTNCHVDAKNGFGGNERLYFYCELKYMEKDTWKLIKLDFK